MQAYFRRAPEVLHLRVGYGLPERDGGADVAASSPAADGPRSAGRAWVAVAELEWSAADDADAALDKLRQLQRTIRADQPKVEEVIATLTCEGDAGVAEAPGAPAVRLSLSVHVPRVTALKMELSRVTGSAGSALSGSVATVVAGGCELESVRTLQAGEGFVPFVLECLPRWASLRSLHLPGAGLTCLPEALLPGLPRLEELHVDHNRLAALPSLAPVAATLRVLSADHNALAALPPGLAACARLRALSLEHNRLERPIVDLRPLGKTLEELRLGGNALDFLPEMSHCTRLRSLSLMNARITADAALRRVEVVAFGDEAGSGGASGGAEGDSAAGAAGASGGGVTPAVAVAAAAAGARESAGALLGRAGAGISGVVGAARGGNRDFSALYALIFRYSSCQLPLLAAAVARLAQEPEQAEAIAAAEGGVQQLLSMVLSDSPLVVAAACRTLAALAEQPPLAVKLFDARAVGRMLALLRRGEGSGGGGGGAGAPAAQCSALRVLAALAWASGGVAAAHLAAPELLAAVRAACRSRHDAVRRCALHALGNIALTPAAARALLAAPGLRALLARLACGAAPDPEDVDFTDGNAAAASSPEDATSARRAPPPPSAGVRRRATRALAILGENALVAAAVGRPHCLSPRRGLRILAMDGGGMRGLATVRMLRRLEAATGRHVSELFDLVCGTSTGGILAVALGVHGHDLDTCEGLYRHLGAAVFSGQRGGRGDESGWQRLSSLYSSTSSRVRVAVSGCKHDAAMFERLVRECCAFTHHADADASRQPRRQASTRAAAQNLGGFDSDDEDAEDAEPALIDTAVRGGPAVFVVATLMTVTPAVPFIFRNYQHPLGEEGADGGEEQRSGPAGAARPVPVGSCRHRLWHAVRASSAAPYYLADFSHGGLRWQDGAVVANNPAALALHEASLRWPGIPVDTLVSLGSGCTPPKPRDASAISRYIDAGAVLVEAACDVHRADDTLQLLAPAAGLQYYRFNPCDERCAVELDDLDDGLLNGLCAATDEYIEREAPRFGAAAAALLRDVEGVARRREPAVVPPSLREARRVVVAARAAAAAAAAAGEAPQPQQPPQPPQPSLPSPSPSRAPLLGGGARRRLGAPPNTRRVFVLDAPRAGAGTPAALLDAPAAAEGASSSTDGAALSPHVAAFAASAAALLRLPVETKDSGAEGGLSPPEACGALADALRRCAAVHCAARCDGRGLALSWRADLLAVAEPGDAADAFLASVSPHWARLPDAGDDVAVDDVAADPEPGLPPSLRALCAAGRAFEAAGVLHAPLGESAHAAPRALFSAVLRRLPPAARLAADDVYASLLGCRRGALLLFSHAPPLSLAAALLDVGAAAVIAPMLLVAASAAPPQRAAAGAASLVPPWAAPMQAPSPPRAPPAAAPPPPSEAQLGRFFTALYAVLFPALKDDASSSADDDDSATSLPYFGDEGCADPQAYARAERAAAALHAAVAAEPSCAHFRVLALRNGALLALRPSAAPPAPVERLRHPASLLAADGTAAGGVVPFATTPQLLMSPRERASMDGAPMPSAWASSPPRIGGSSGGGRSSITAGATSSPARGSFSPPNANATAAAAAAASAPPPSPARASMSSAWASLGLGSPDGSWWGGGAGRSTSPPRR